MERMTGLDASFLYMETPTLHMHTLKISVVDPSGIVGGYSFQRFRDELSRRLHLLPPFRRRIVPVPLGLDHPVWIEDPHFDLDNHVVRVDVAAPGGPREMDELIGRIASRQLRRDRPLWQIWVIEGLEGGQVAFVAKIHHAAADGIAAGALLANVLSLDPEPHEPAPPERPWRPDPMPGRLRLMWDALKDRSRRTLTIPALVKRTRINVKALGAHQAGSDIQTPKPVRDTPRTSFNGSITARRVFATASYPLEDFKAVKSAFGVSLNDVVLATVSGSMRTYLAARGEQLDKPLVAGVPVSSDRPGDDPRLGGNRVTNMFTSLRTDVDDPVERLKAISAVTGAAKDRINILGADLMADWAEHTPPRPFAWAVRTYSKHNLASRHSPPINLVVSNVPGPRFPLYIAGARLTDLFSVGPILEGIGLNVTVWSYIDRMNVSAIACTDRLPEVHEVTEGIGDALQELLRAAEHVSA
jgi:diacylglycerol O-acyltransferase